MRWDYRSLRRIGRWSWALSKLSRPGHYLAILAAMRILDRGGNAVDAGVAAGLCLGMLYPDMASVAGVAPIIFYHADRQEVTTISGLRRWRVEPAPHIFRPSVVVRFPLVFSAQSSQRLLMHGSLPWSVTAPCVSAMWRTVLLGSVRMGIRRIA
jgi:gamma-glutamyltranspeptidase